MPLTQPLQNDSQMLYLQAKYQFEKAQQAFQDGTIKTEKGLIQAVFKAFQDFFLSLGKPMLTPRYAVDGGPPISDDYNQMMQEILQDLTLLYQEVDILGRGLYTDFNYNQVQAGQLKAKFDEVSDKLKDLELLSGTSADDATIVQFRENFTNSNDIDFDRIMTEPATIENGTVTLKAVNTENLSPNATVTIVVGDETYTNFIIGSDSNGFPGNNAEVTVQPGSSLTGTDNQYTFLGEKDNHGNYGAVLDGNSNTWFEYELNNLRDQEAIRVAKNLGWDYQVSGNQTIRWARDPDNGALRLHLQIVLDEVTQINHININMYTPPNYGAQPAIVKNILVSDGVSAPQSVLSPDKKDTDYSFYFAPIKAKTISILFEQPTKYYTDLGHIYYRKKDSNQDTVQYAITQGGQPPQDMIQRVDGPLISIEDLGVTVTDTGASVSTYYPMKGPESNGYSIGDILTDLTRRVQEEDIDIGVERFEGYRYCIGIRDIEIYSFQYEQQGEIVSKPYYFEQPLQKVALSVDEVLPDAFGEDADSYLQYFISIDDGATWYPITPLERSITGVTGGEEGPPPKIYTIEQVDSPDQSITKPGYIETQYPVYSLRVRCLLSRPGDAASSNSVQQFGDGSDDLTFATPILKGYTVKGYIQGQVSDSAASHLIAQAPDQVDPYPSDDDTPFFPSGSDNNNGGSDTGGGAGGTGGTGGVGGIGGTGDTGDTGGPGTGGSGGSGSTGDSGGSGGSGGDTGGNTGNNGDSGSGGSDGSGGSGGSGSSGSGEDTENPTLRVVIDNKNEQQCIEDPLTVSGTVETSKPLDKIVLIINGSVEQTNDNPDSGTEVPFQFQFPLDDFSAGDSIAVEVKAFDNVGNTAEDDYVLTLEDCSQDGGQQVRDCLLYSALVIHYFNPVTGSIEVANVPMSWLPYEIDNGAGVKATFAFNQSLNGIVAMITDGYDTTGYAFPLWAVGVEYLDEYNDQKTSWAQTILNQTEGVKNAELMLGDPSTKDPSGWIAQIMDGNLYTNAPCIGSINDYVVFGFDEDLQNRHCTVDGDWDPEAHKKDISDTDPPVDPYDPNKNPVRNCLSVEKVCFQYYSDVTNELEMVIVPMSLMVNYTYTLETKAGNVDLLIGWSEYFKGISLYVKDATGDTNVQLTGVGVMFRDYYDNIKTAWANGTSYWTRGVKHTEYMIGGPKELGDLTWVAEVESGDFSNAPCIGAPHDFVVMHFYDVFTGNVCPIDPSQNTDSTIGIDPNNPPDVPTVKLDALLPDWCQSTDLPITGTITDWQGVTSYVVSVNGVKQTPISGQGQASVPINLTIPTGDYEPGETLTITVTATNINGKTGSASVSTVIKDCSPPPQIAFDPISDPVCYRTLGDSHQLTIAGTITDDTAVSRWQVVYGDAVIADTTLTPMPKSTRFSVPVTITFPEPTITTTAGKADIVFLIDYTGSMSGPIQSIRSNLQAFCNSLTSNKIDFRLAVVFYGDITGIGGNMPYIRHDWTSDVTQFLNNLAVTVSGGGDTPESTLDAIMDASQGGMSFLPSVRSDAVPFFIVVTDAPTHAKGYDSLSIYDPDQVANTLKDQGVVASFVTQLTDPIKTQYNPIVSETGGQFFDISSGTFGVQMQALTNQITKQSLYYPDSTATITVNAWDEKNTMATSSITVNLKTC
ncbi:vWA domain-containing protein [Alicyclobacillus shizuokensis]|uniref:vWA domain-containing protein n=1 Tax=Alicyclobacillus shizuokensis TaxID=392014 RepID=UPI000832AD27|nr:vWA domain-containing protein [Alicyclobacillus shizuokensis]